MTDLPDQEFHIGIKALITNEKNEILLLKSGPAEQKYTKIEFWDLPGGRIKTGQSIHETLKREIEEELGISSEAMEIKELFDSTIANFKASNEKNLGLLLVVYNCKLHGEHKFKLSDEHSEWKWMPATEAQKVLSTKFGKTFIDKLNSQNK